jgi:CDP-glucose 4,6-dehydratase
MFWNEKKILITGHTGFKGSWLSLWLQHLGANLIGFALPPPTIQNMFTVTDTAKYMLSILGDIRHFSEIRKVIEQHRPEIIFHMAAQPLVRYSYENPLETYTTNVIGTANLLEAVRQTDSVKVIVNVTTDKCYENKEWHWSYRENERLGGHDPYSNSKACAELVTSAYRNSYLKQRSIGLATARAGNVIGGGDWAQDRLIPDLIRGNISNKPVTIRYPHALRPWQHVLEPLSAYLQLAEKLYGNPDQFSEAWNFGPNEDDVKPVSWIADYITNLLRNDGKGWILEETPQPHEASFLKLDCSKAKAKLGWQPRWNLEKGLKETVNWYQAFESKENMREVTLMQIENFTTHEEKIK